MIDIVPMCRFRLDAKLDALESAFPDFIMTKGFSCRGPNDKKRFISCFGSDVQVEASPEAQAVRDVVHRIQDDTGIDWAWYIPAGTKNLKSCLPAYLPDLRPLSVLAQMLSSTNDAFYLGWDANQGELMVVFWKDGCRQPIGALDPTFAGPIPSIDMGMLSIMPPKTFSNRDRALALSHPLAQALLAYRRGDLLLPS